MSMAGRAAAWMETRVPPPLLMLLCGLLAWLLARALPFWQFEAAWMPLIAVPLAVAGLALNLLPKLQFARAATTVNPLAPQRATQLVSDGLYRYSRNPMYLGQATVLLAWTLGLQHALAPLLVLLFIAWITRLQIIPEERALAARFPAPFAQLCARTRRWL